jgi:alginate O-acetyltransferase complex protein AlgI
MSFISIEFAIFLPVVFLIYWIPLKKSRNYQNLFLLLASYFFYGWWDWRFLALILFSSSVDFVIGNLIHESAEQKRRKRLLALSVCVNLGMLFFFKYYNFFLDSLVESFTFLGQPINIDRLDIILPIGISFYTFQTLSYTIDIYRSRLTPSKDIFVFFTFVSFFPQLVAGPIERATNLLPQFYKERVFSVTEVKEGLRQILWGLFKKIVIADNCAIFVDTIFDAPESFTGSKLLLGAIFFSFQIYGDFSGYSDIAIGTARILGFNLMQNFANPYFSRDVAEFWRRWHISLSTWFRDYLYIPLGGSRGSNWLIIRNTFIIFLVSGLWHGANWTFVIWGLAHTLLFLPLIVSKNNRKHLGPIDEGKWFPSFKNLIRIVFNFLLVSMAWVFFRAESLGSALDYFSVMFSPSLFSMPMVSMNQGMLLGGIAFLLLMEWGSRTAPFPLDKMEENYSQVMRWAIYALLVWAIILFKGEPQTFIYFQF